MYKLSLLFIIALLLGACTKQKPSITYFDAQYGYAETVVIEEGLKKTIIISGQIGTGDDLETQMLATLTNLNKQLQKHGADYSNLIKINSFIVNHKPEDLVTFRNVREEVFENDVTPASTLVGVQALAKPEWLIEIDAEAVIFR